MNNEPWIEAKFSASIIIWSSFFLKVFFSPLKSYWTQVLKSKIRFMEALKISLKLILKEVLVANCKMFAGCSSCSSHLIPLLLSHIRLLHPLRDNGNGLECPLISTLAHPKLLMGYMM